MTPRRLTLFVSNRHGLLLNFPNLYLLWLTPVNLRRMPNLFMTPPPSFERVKCCNRMFITRDSHLIPKPGTGVHAKDNKNMFSESNDVSQDISTGMSIYSEKIGDHFCRTKTDIIPLSYTYLRK